LGKTHRQPPISISKKRAYIHETKLPLTKQLQDSAFPDKLTDAASQFPRLFLSPRKWHYFSSPSRMSVFSHISELARDTNQPCSWLPYCRVASQRWIHKTFVTTSINTVFKMIKVIFRLRSMLLTIRLWNGMQHSKEKVWMEGEVVKFATTHFFSVLPTNI